MENKKLNLNKMEDVSGGGGTTVYKTLCKDGSILYSVQVPEEVLAQYDKEDGYNRGSIDFDFGFKTMEEAVNHAIKKYGGVANFKVTAERDFDI